MAKKNWIKKMWMVCYNSTLNRPRGIRKSCSRDFRSRRTLKKFEICYFLNFYGVNLRDSDAFSKSKIFTDCLKGQNPWKY